MKFGDLLAIVRLLHVNRKMPGHTRNGAGKAVHDYTSAAKHGPINPSNSLEIQKPILADMRNHQTEFVRVASKKDLRRSFRIEHCEDIPVRVALDLLRELPGVGRPDALAANFEARR